MSLLIRSWRAFGIGVLSLFSAASVLLVAGAVILRASLASLDGAIEVAGIEETVSIERDARGIPQITAASWPDLAVALGFVHSQERFFQMDLARRAAAGELAALLGAAALPTDKSRRMHRLRALATARLATLEPTDRQLLTSYTAGVNAGLDALSSRPFEYWLLGADPVVWREEDVLLVVYSMFFELTDETAGRDAMLTALRDSYPEAFADFLMQAGTTWDAPVSGTPRNPQPVPAAGVYALPAADAEAATASLRRSEEGAPVVPGSNNWALHGSRTESGSAILANDMHLGLGLPNTWYRARLVLRNQPGDDPIVDVSGVTLPGAFGIVVGSNGKVAWGFTNSQGDWSDRVLVETSAEDDSVYRVDSGYEAFVEHDERIEVKGDAPVMMRYRWTRWGPIIGQDHAGRQVAVKWLAHEADAINLRIVDLASVQDVSAALTVANQVGAPPQNFVAADRKGNIGWTILGRIPRRAGYDPRFSTSWAAPGVGWQGWLEVTEYPRIFNPPGGQIWTANARVIDGEWLSVLGDGGYALGARAGQIRDALRPIDSADEADMLAVQLDDRAVFLDRWQGLLVETLDEAALADNPQRAELRDVVASWRPQASVDSAGFRLVRAWRQFMLDAVFAVLTAEARNAAPDVSFYSHQWEGALWTLLETQPPHLLPPAHASWRSWKLAVVDETIAYFKERYPGGLAERVWGERNLVRVAHPLSSFVPGLGGLVDMPAIALPGDSNMPRVQAPGFGASQRLAVSPGRESEGYLHMPGGQSGHPLSPYYGTQHEAWASGKPLPFLPGPPVTTLLLVRGD